jgi:hypothetical protein
MPCPAKSLIGLLNSSASAEISEPQVAGGMSFVLLYGNKSNRHCYAHTLLSWPGFPFTIARSTGASACSVGTTPDPYVLA